MQFRTTLHSFFGLAVFLLAQAATAATPTPTPSPTPGASQRTIILKWNPPVSGAAPLGYKLYWGTGSGNYQNARDVKDAVTSSITLEKSVRYYIVATSYSMSGESRLSNQVIVPPSW